MKNTILKFLPLLLVIGLASCFDYETQFDGPYSDEENNTGFKLPKKVVYVAGGNVYLANEFAKDSIRIDNSATVDVASINNDHTNVLFKRTGENINIYNIESESITGQVPNTETAIWFDYHANNETIYFLLSNNLLDTYGPEVLTNRPIDLRTLGSVTGNVKGVAVMNNGEFVFSKISAIGNSEYLIKSDGINILKQFTTTFFHKNFRLNKGENWLWIGDTFDDGLYYYRMPEVSKYDDQFDYFIGAPTNSGFGYRVTQDNKIRNSIWETIQSPGGQITSIDH